MKLSIITPTHNPKHLPELERSILDNSHKDWEWIILLNNNAMYRASDPRIKIVESEKATTFVGALKKEACSHATGQVIVEVDHDDIITPDCLEKVNEAFESNTSIGFVYSDNAKLSDTFRPYDSFWGWTHKEFDWNGKKLIAMNSQPLTPGRFGFIWFAPDHVRAWRKDVYDSIGGHDETLEVCDDLDLMHRLYLVTDFYHIPEVLYIYRIDGSNTWLEKNQLIQKLTMDIFYRDIGAITDRFCEKHDLIKVDLCGAFNKPKGYVSIDLQDADINADLNEGIPLPDNSCGVVRAYDALEHLKDPIKTMTEIHRVLAPGGLLISNTPSTDGRGAWQDPTHVSFWNENSFWYWTRDTQAKYIRNNKRFFESVLRTWYPSEHHKHNKIPYVQAILEKI